MSSYNPYQQSQSGPSSGRGRGEYGGDGDRNTQQGQQQAPNSGQQMGYSQFPSGVPPPVQQQYNSGNPYQRNIMPPAPQAPQSQQRPQQSYNAHEMTNSSNSLYQQQQQQYTTSPPGYNNRQQVVQQGQQQTQQTEYSKYQFLPYGQPTHPPPQQPYGYYGGGQWYPTVPPRYPQHQQFPSYPTNQTAVQGQAAAAAAGYSYPAYGQPPPQSQAPGNYYPPQPQHPQYPPNYSLPNSNSYQQLQGVMPSPVPAPVPAPVPVPPPVQPVSKEKKPDSKRGPSKKEVEDASQEPEWDRKRPAEKSSKEEQPPSVPEPKEIKKSVPIMVGKRRGGRTLPTGVVKKQRAASPEPNKRTDAWSQYMNEVKRYKERSCEDERKNRPLVK